jgi:hypothetical protein
LHVVAKRFFPVNEKRMLKLPGRILVVIVISVEEDRQYMEKPFF